MFSFLFHCSWTLFRLVSLQFMVEKILSRNAFSHSLSSLCSWDPCADEPLLFLLSLEMGKKEAAERYNDGKGLQGRKGRESLGQ